MGGAQPLAATFAGACVAEHRVPAVAHRLPPAHRATSTSRPSDLDDALARIAQLHRGEARRCRSACSATPPRSCPSWSRRGVRPDLVTDQTSAHDLVNGYLPAGLERRALAGRAGRRRRSTPRCATPRRRAAPSHVQAMLDFQAMGVPTVDYGNNIRQVAFDAGVEERVRLPRLRAGLHPAAVLPRQGAVPLGRAVGRPGGHPQDRREDEGAVPRRTRTCTAGSTWPASASPSRACRRASAGSASASGTAPAWRSTRWCKSGELKAPIVIGRDHLDTRLGRVARTARPRR